MKNFKKTWTGSLSFLDNNIVNAIIVIILILYSSTIFDNINSYIGNLYNYSIIKIIVLLLIIYIAPKDTTIAILLAISYLVSINYMINNENFTSGYDLSKMNVSSSQPMHLNVNEESHNSMGMQKAPSQHNVRMNESFSSKNINNREEEHNSMQKAPSQNNSMQKAAFQHNNMQKAPFQHNGMQKPPSQHNGMQKPPSHNNSSMHESFSPNSENLSEENQMRYKMNESFTSNKENPCPNGMRLDPKTKKCVEDFFILDTNSYTFDQSTYNNKVDDEYKTLPIHHKKNTENNSNLSKNDCLLNYVPKFETVSDVCSPTATFKGELNSQGLNYPEGFNNVVIGSPLE